MPYASKAQARAFHAKEERGEIPASTVDEYDKATDFKNLPERKSGGGGGRKKKRKGAGWLKRNMEA